jgi:hypothetical protein
MYNGVRVEKRFPWEKAYDLHYKNKGGVLTFEPEWKNMGWEHQFWVLSGVDGSLNGRDYTPRTFDEALKIFQKAIDSGEVVRSLGGNRLLAESFSADSRKHGGLKPQLEREPQGYWPGECLKCGLEDTDMDNVFSWSGNCKSCGTNESYGRYNQYTKKDAESFGAEKKNEMELILAVDGGHHIEVMSGDEDAIKYIIKQSAFIEEYRPDIGMPEDWDMKGKEWLDQWFEDNDLETIAQETGWTITKVSSNAVFWGNRKGIIVADETWWGA